MSQSSRTPEQIIASILANLEMARDAARSKARSTFDSDTYLFSHGQAAFFSHGQAASYEEAITLIKTEAGIK